MKPICLCNTTMDFFLDNKKTTIWKCPRCGWLFEVSPDLQVWYRPTPWQRTPKSCQRLDTCKRIKMIRDKDLADFQYEKAINSVCAKCTEFIRR